jgi:serine/threonine-protein kinase RsbW
VTAVTAGEPSAAPPRARPAFPSGQQRPAAPQPQHADDVVTITLPAEGAYLSVLRTATAGLAARLDFTLDEIEDLRIAVDEACAMLLTKAIAGADLECRFTLAGATLTVEVSVLSQGGTVPSQDTFAWTVLQALAGSVEATADLDDRVSINLAKTRQDRETGQPASGPDEAADTGGPSSG